MDIRRLRLSSGVIMALLALSVLAVYGQAHKFDFVSFDDYMYVKDNPNIHQGITADSIKWAFTATYAGNWHPLTWLSHMLDVDLFGLKPGMHHAVNVLIHLLNTLLLFMVLKRTTGESAKSAIVAALFALHPLHVESVAWVAERKDVLSALFMMLTILAYTDYVGNRSPGRYILVALLYSLGLMAKSMLVSLPFVLLLLDIWPLRRTGITATYGELSSYNGGIKSTWMRRRGIMGLLLEKVPLLMLAVMVSIMTLYAQGSNSAISGLDMVPLFIRIENAIFSCLYYLVKTVWPLHLAVFYPFPSSIPGIYIFLASVVLIAVSLLAMVMIKRLPFIATGWFWYLVMLIPVIGIVQVGSQSMADRYTYLPLIGIFIMVAWGLPELLGRLKTARYLLAAAVWAVLPLLMWVSYVQVGFWKNNMTLFSHALVVTRDNYVAHNNLGTALCDSKRYDLAMGHFREALRIKPNYVYAHSNLGGALVELGMYSESIDHFRRALNFDPDHVNTHLNLGIALDALGRVDEAAVQYRKVLQLSPKHSGASLRLVRALERQKRIDAVIMKMKDAIEAHPHDYQLQLSLAELYKSIGKTGEAIAWYERLLSNQPESIQTLDSLILLYAAKGDYDKALSLAQQMVKLRPDSPEAYYNVSCIYARQSRVSEAVKWLSISLEKGFDDRQLLMKDPDLESIRDTTFYRTVTGRLKKERPPSVDSGP